jgi:hypothetical protein
MILKTLLKEISNNRYTIYQDMDGCIVDFDSRYEHFTGKSPKEMDEYLQQKYGKEKSKEIFWENINEVGTVFWSDMEWMEDGKKLWRYIEKYNPTLLSSPSRSKTSHEGKKLWVKKHLPTVPLILKQANEKQEYACPQCILIDDRLTTISQWKTQGGIGIHHINAHQTINELKELGL